MTKPNEKPSAKQIFRARSTRISSEPKMKTDLINLWENKYILHGRVDFEGNPVFVREYRGFSDITSANNSVHHALDFVAEAFVDFRRYYYLAMKRGVISSNTRIKFNVERAYESINQAYHDHNDKFHTKAFRWLTPSNTSDIVNFRDFCKFMIREVEKQKSPEPITRTGFLMSRHSSVLNTGLAIEISNKDYNDEFYKNEHYRSDPNFKFFVESAKKFGFLVDKNIPWRLIADLRTKPMQEYMDMVSNTSINRVFRDYYHYSFNHDLTSLRDYFKVYYDDFVLANPTISKLNGSCTQVIEREKQAVSPEPQFWIKAYAFLRAIEEKKPWTQAVFDNFVLRAIDAYKTGGISKAVRYINQEFKNKESGTERPEKNNLTNPRIADIVEPHKRRGSFRF